MMRPFCVLLPFAAGVAAIGLSAGTATAGISGPCSASLAGVNVGKLSTGATSKAITVRHSATVPIVMRAAGGLSHVKIVLQFAGLSWTVKDKAVKTPVYTDTIPVKNYARYGVGLYKVQGQASGPGVSCTGSALVKVKGNPFASVAGIAGIGAALLGAAGLGAGALGGGGGFRPFSVARSSIAGLIAALGILVLLQQAAVLYPTALVAIVGLAAGLGTGLALPLLGHTVGHGAGRGAGISGHMPTPSV